MEEIKHISDELRRAVSVPENIREQIHSERVEMAKKSLHDYEYQRALDEYKAKWSFAEHGDYKTYVEAFKYIEPGSKEDTRSKYRAYLMSPEWKRKRLMVLKRDNNTCQSCLSRRAIDVHHLTYDHIYNEPLFDLVSVCRDCHESITRMDKGETYNRINHA